MSESNYDLSSKNNYGDCILATHASDIAGPPDYLIRYFLTRTRYFIVMKYPLSSSDQIRPNYKVFKNGAMIEEKKSNLLLKPFILNYIKDVILTIYWSLKLKRKYKLQINIYAGCNNLLAIAGSILSKLTRVNKIIFYSVDYSDRRFKNNLLNKFYLWIDKKAALSSQSVWSNTDRTRAIRRTKGVKEENNILVPNGVTKEDIPNATKNYDDNIIRIEYHGYLGEGKGIQNVISALEKLNKDNFIFDIIGYGNYEQKLRNQIEQSKFSRKIHLLGKKSNKETLALIVNYDLCVALLNTKEDYLRYCDPMKIKEALACRIPILISNVPEIAERIKNERLGIVVEDGEHIDEVAEALQPIFDNKSLLSEYRQNLSRMKDELDWDYIYDKALITLNK